jgi:septal ring factor EnvC (AmiA/AmiB activator)
VQTYDEIHLTNVLRQQLFARITELTSKLSDTESELEDKKDVIKVVRDNVKKQNKEIQDLHREKVSLQGDLSLSLWYWDCG